MKALILNSGLGKRMGKYTEHNPKCMVPLEGGTTIVARQMALLQKCGVKEVVMQPVRMQICSKNMSEKQELI